MSEKEHEREWQWLFREGDKVMQIKNNYQIEWEVRGRYGIPVEKGLAFSMVIWELSGRSMSRQSGLP